MNVTVFKLDCGKEPQAQTLDFQFLPRLPHEQALLSSILAKTASNIIDVSAADSQGMEQHEYMDQARHQPHQVLASEPVPFSDLRQVSRIAYAYSALSQIRVDEKEELVVQFGIP
ncbi:Ragulator complex protein LAMTOR1 [Sciurus carolinensis]|uniref:Ragulator complex protein LAMTOR1 n=1 Tax=Sciurus carolinensis TaxID=30640 RepID=A0AA41NCE0_SCICA|nr:Ragulator complex protein LAMTOR1 [Sciurus carolinensis]